VSEPTFDAGPLPTPAELEGLLADLRQGAAALRDVPVAQVAEALGRVGERFVDPADPLRRRALELLPAHAGMSAPQVRYILDGMARDWTRERLQRLLREEFHDPGVLDGFRDAPARAGAGASRRLRVLGPELSVHLCSGTVPGVSVTSLVRGLLLKGAVLLKPGAGDVVLPVLFQRALADAGQVGRRLSAAAAVLYWPGGSEDAEALESRVLAAADQVVIYGSDDTVRSVRSRLSGSVQVVPYAHRVSVAVLGAGAFADPGAADALATAVSSFDQRGCVCPQQAFLVGADADTARAFARHLADALERAALTLPPVGPEPGEAAAVQQLRGTAELRAAAGEGVTLLTGEGLTWTVVLDPTRQLRPSCLARTIHLTPVPSVEALARILAPVARHLQSVGVAGLASDDQTRLAEVVARAGGSRVAPLAELPFPPAWWLHDGQGPLRRLARIVEWSTAASR
jgi:hypothetical protein